MFISDLDHIETVAETPTLLGGFTVQWTVADIRQLSTAKAIASSIGGNANATAIALNFSTLYQDGWIGG